MDEPMIDRLAQAFHGASRRHALRTALHAAAAATAGVVASGLGGNAKQRKKCKKKSCKALALGAECETNRQCCPNETNRICAFASGLPGPICCGVLGATCAGDSACCGGFVCFEGSCAFAG